MNANIPSDQNENGHVPSGSHIQSLSCARQLLEPNKKKNIKKQMNIHFLSLLQKEKIS